jgi:calcineurin-like phosphoesterase family protein
MTLHLRASLVGALFLCACQEGVQLAATGTAEPSNAPAERSSPTESQARQCGAGGLSPVGDQQMDRLPYLQQVSATSALVLFTTRGVQARPTLELALPGGREVQSSWAELDPTDPTGQQWIAALTGLQPNSTYCYRLRGLTEPIGFRTAPLPETDASVRFVVFGDSGGGGEIQDAVRDQLDTVPFDLMLHTGDIAYGSGRMSQLEALFFDEYSALIQSIPVFPASGNHDYGTEAGAPYRQVFALPENGAPEGLERWYSFDWGDVHFVALDTERVDAAQTLWLERDLAENSLPWTVVYLHRPPYSSGEHGSSSRVREAFSPLFAEYGVQLVLAGHDHDYERTQPIDGVTYVVTGGGGKGTRPVGSSSFTAYSEAVLHFVVAEARGDTLSLHAIDAVGREFDSVRIARFPKGSIH